MSREIKGPEDVKPDYFPPDFASSGYYSAEQFGQALMLAMDAARTYEHYKALKGKNGESKRRKLLQRWRELAERLRSGK